jgi:Domain of unknown function (DUF2017)
VTGGEEMAPGEGEGMAPGEDAEEIAEEIMAGFRRTAHGVSARFTAAQAGIVRTLVGQIAELVAGHGETGAATGAEPADAEQPTQGAPVDLAAMLGPEGPVSPPDDPVLARLFPDGYQEDPAAAGEFRKYTEQSLRSGKVAAAQTVLATLPPGGGRVRLSAEDGEAWLRALNDVRLALGVRLGITEEYEHELTGGDDPRSAYLQVYDWLTYLQETLVQALWAGP